MLIMKELEKSFQNAIRDDAGFIGVKIQMPGFEEPEIIINPSENFETKLEYYKKAYNEDLTLKTFNQIKIIGIAYGTLDDIEDLILDR